MKINCHSCALTCFPASFSSESARRHLINNLADIEGTKKTFSSSFLENSFLKAGHNFVPFWRYKNRYTTSGGKNGITKAFSTELNLSVKSNIVEDTLMARSCEHFEAMNLLSNRPESIFRLFKSKTLWEIVKVYFSKF